MSEIGTCRLDSLVAIDPESLPMGTAGSFEFTYFDISSASNGSLKLPETSITYAEAPSRARRIVRNDDVVMSTVRPNLKAFAYCDLPEGNFVASSGFSVLRAIGENSSRFVLYSLLSDDVTRQIESHVVGSNYPAINSSDVKRLKISAWLPHQQRRIAEILTTMDEEIDATEELIAKHQQIKAGLMHDLFTRGLWTQAELDRGDHKGTPSEASAKPGQLRPTPDEAPELYRNTEIGLLPKEWAVNELRNWLSYLSYGFTNPMPTSEDGPYMVTAADVTNGGVQYETCRRTTRLAYERLLTDKSRPKIGDVLLTKDGTLGRIAVVERENVCINQSVAVLRTSNPNHTKFLAEMLSSPRWQQKMISDAGGSTIKHIYITVIDKMFVGWPIHPTEADGIVAHIETANQLLTTETTHLAKLRQQKQGLMHDLLTGRVRVESDR